MLSVLRQPRYAALGVLMALVALVCIGAGTWQVARFEQKRSQNGHLRANAHAAAVPVGALLPLVGHGDAPSASRLEFRAVRATGTYVAGDQVLVRNRSIGDDTGFLVLTPLRTASGVLLVVRGFLPQPGSGAIPAIPAPPGGPVTVVARAHAAESQHDQAAVLRDRQVESVNPRDQQARTGQPTYDGYVSLEAGQPGATGTPIPKPDLSNPAGGALEPQHFAYVIQWYLFAALALAAPFAMARAETRHGRRGAIDFDAQTEPATAEEETDEERRARKLADRYGRPVG